MHLIRSHLGRLFEFGGRENREPFWLWILVLYVAQTALGLIVSIPLTSGMMSAFEPLTGRDQAYLDQHPELVSQVIAQAMVPFVRNVLIFSVVLGILFLLLAAAAVVRRLHDGDRSGWWAAPMPVLQVATLAVYATALPRFFGLLGELRPDATPEHVNAVMTSIVPSFMLAGLLGLIGFAMLVLLIVLLCLRGTVGPNRYGDDLLPPPPLVPPQPVAQAPAVVAAPPPARIVRPTDAPPQS